MKKSFILVILILMLALVACDEKKSSTTPPVTTTTETGTVPVVTTDNLPAPESISVYAEVNFNARMVVGESTQKLDIVTIPSDASQYVIWTSSEEGVATVDENGVVTAVGAGNTTIYAISRANPDIMGEFKITVFDDNASTNKINQTKNYLNSLIPDELNDDISLPISYNDGMVRLSWKSSNSNVLSATGSFNRDDEDTKVTLTCTIASGRVDDVWSKEILIKGINSIVREDLSNKQAVFMYLADSGFSGYRDGDLDGIDVINYSFARINTTTHEITLSGLKNYSSVIKARNYGIRVVLSVGGWACDGFSVACSTDANRKVFVDSIIAAIISHKFDGVDMDWEYPTSTEAGYAASGSDRANFTTVMKMLREEMDKIDESLILSAALSGSTPQKIQRYYDIPQIAKYLDYAHLMTYSMSLQATYHNSALYYSEGKSRPSNPVSIESVCNSYVEAGFKPKQIVIGIPFFGVVSFTSNDGVNGDGIGATATSSSETAYRIIARNYLNNSAYKVYQDTVAKACYIYGNNVFVSYDEAYAIDAKCQFAKIKGYGGVMVWEYNQDDSQSTLTKRIMFNFM